MNNLIDDLRQMLSVSLPRHTRWEFRETWVEFDFSRTTEPLRCITDEDISGDIPQEWISYRPFGEELFSNGCALLCIDEVDGSVKRVDVELDDPVSLLNMSVRQFIESFGALDALLAHGCGTLGDVGQALRAIDQVPYEAGSHWQMLMEYLSDDD